jgi:hypothetical protein
MSSEPPEQSDKDFKYPISVTSPELPSTTLSQAIHENLTSVAALGNDFLQNLEPELARISQSIHGHATIAPAPSHHIHQDLPASSNGLTNNVGPTSMETAAIIAASSLAASGLDAPHPETIKSKRLNRACDACSRRKVKVGCDSHTIE